LSAISEGTQNNRVHKFNKTKDLRKALNLDAEAIAPCFLVHHMPYHPVNTERNTPRGMIADGIGV